MRFKVRQLMITVIPERKQTTKIPGRGINTKTADGDCHGISLPPCHNTKPWGQSWRDPIVNPQDLAALHEQLIVQLDKVEEKQKGFEESLNPHSIAEIDLLEKHLQEALSELKAQRVKLQRTTPVPK